MGGADEQVEPRRYGVRLVDLSVQSTGPTLDAARHALAPLPRRNAQPTGDRSRDDRLLRGWRGSRPPARDEPGRASQLRARGRRRAQGMDVRAAEEQRTTGDRAGIPDLSLPAAGRKTAR